MYIKGGSVVDGNFYIEGGLRVNSITDARGNVFISTDEVVPGAIIKFSETDSGKIINSNIKETTVGSFYMYELAEGYAIIAPLRTVSGYPTTDTTVKYYDANYNALSSSSGAIYRTLTTAEKKNLTVTTASKVIPDAWVYVG